MKCKETPRLLKKAAGKKSFEPMVLYETRQYNTTSSGFWKASILKANPGKSRHKDILKISMDEIGSP